MRNLALAIAATLVLAVVSPAFAQPFADVPTDHWAFDAIAELAAKGIIEGFPDGTFKGDRGVTRYEVSMIVARILARIEAIKIPGPAAPAPAAPAPQVTRADVQTIQRLVNEFRAELAALGVRVTAVEEELTALKQSSDNVKVSGETLIEYAVNQTPGAVGSIESRNRIQFTAKSAPFTFVGRLCLAGSPPDNGNCLTPWGGNTAVGTFGLEAASFDLAYVDWSAGPMGTNWRAGRQRYTLGSNGLLFNTIESSGDAFDGLRVNALSLGPVSLNAGFWLDTENATTNIWTLDAALNLLPGWNTKVYYLAENPIGAASRSGWEVALGGNLFGLNFNADYASFATTTAWRAGVTFDLGAMLMGEGTTLQLVYKDYGPGTAGTTAPLWSNAETTVYGGNTWDLRSTFGRLDLTLNPSWGVWASYETGNVKSSGASLAEYEVGATYQLGGGATVDIYWERSEAAGAVTDATYYVDFSMSW